MLGNTWILVQTLTGIARGGDLKELNVYVISTTFVQHVQEMVSLAVKKFPNM